MLPRGKSLTVSSMSSDMTGCFALPLVRPCSRSCCLLPASCSACCSSQHSAGMFPPKASIHTQWHAAHAHWDRGAAPEGHSVWDASFFSLYQQWGEERRNFLVLVSDRSSVLLYVDITWEMKADVFHTYPFQTDATALFLFVSFVVLLLRVNEVTWKVEKNLNRVIWYENILRCSVIWRNYTNKHKSVFCQQKYIWGNWVYFLQSVCKELTS